MTNDGLMTRARSANPVSPTAFEDWPSSSQGDELVEHIIAMPERNGSGRPPLRHANRAVSARRRNVWVGVAAALILGIIALQQNVPGARRAWAAPLVKIAEGSPRLLVTGEGWGVVRADEFSGEIGEMTFAEGDYELDLYWTPAAQHDAIVEDRERGAERSWKLTIAGQEGVLFQYEDTTIFTAVWRQGDHSLELRGGFNDVDQFRAVAASVEAVDVDAWLSAMPESVVQPAMRAASVEAMLADIPVHPSVDVEQLKTSRRIRDRYQLGAEVTGAVACAWIEQWVDATAAGDDSAVQEAVDAMATSHNWAILLEMNDEGDWPEVVWQHADAMPGDDPIPAGRLMTIEESYRSALGCDIAE